MSLLSPPSDVAVLARSRRAGRRARARLGYTVVEVLIALGILAIGGSAIISLQKVSVMGAVNSRNLVSASSLASGYLGRMEGEAAATWTPLNPTGMSGTVFNRAMAVSPAWVTADPNGTGAAEDALTLEGRVDTTQATAYCSYVRAIRLADDIYRIEARTVYLKNGQDIAGTCALSAATVNAMIDGPGTVNDGAATRHRDEYGVAFVSSAVRRGQ